MPLTRILLLNETKRRQVGYLRAAADLCRRLEVKPVVLTIARSERQAHLQEQDAREALTGHGLSCDFDFVVGSEVKAAVAGVARWRRCQLVIMDRANVAPWWRWLRGSTWERLIDLEEPLAFLSLSAEGASASSAGAVGTEPLSAEVVGAKHARLRQSSAAGTIPTTPANVRAS
jgi:K+-sensing histidine kinase KdpD